MFLGATDRIYCCVLSIYGGAEINVQPEPALPDSSILSTARPLSRGTPLPGISISSHKHPEQTKGQSV